MTPSRRPASLRGALIACATTSLFFASRSAFANPRPLPFTYPYETLPEGEAEIEQYVDTTPLRALDASGGKVWEPRYVLQTEYEYGITDRLELGLYLVFQNDAGGPLMFDGTKQRLRLRFAESGEWPVDVAVYGEVSELHDELELEQKVIFAKRFENLRVMANLWVEESLEHYGDEVEVFANPTLGFTYQITPSLHLGAEYWLHARLGEKEDEAPPTPLAGAAIEFNDATHHYLGPAVSLQFGKLWWTTAAYWRLDHGTRTTQVGDQFGHVWVRSVIGLSL